MYHGNHNDVCSLLSCRARVCTSVVVHVKMESKENIHPDDLVDFELPPIKRNRTRFKQLASKEEMLNLSKGFVAENTTKTLLGLTRSSWSGKPKGTRTQRKNSVWRMFDKPDKLNYWLVRFVAEVRRQDEKPYPPKTIHQLLAALQQHCSKRCWIKCQLPQSFWTAVSVVFIN